MTLDPPGSVAVCELTFPFTLTRDSFSQWLRSSVGKNHVKTASEWLDIFFDCMTGFAINRDVRVTWPIWASVLRADYQLLTADELAERAAELQEIRSTKP